MIIISYSIGTFVIIEFFVIMADPEVKTKNFLSDKMWTIALIFEYFASCVTAIYL
jgi:hypothetical protein